MSRRHSLLEISSAWTRFLASSQEPECGFRQEVMQRARTFEEEEEEEQQELGEQSYRVSFSVLTAPFRNQVNLGLHKN